MNKNEAYWNERAADYDRNVMGIYEDAYRKTFEKSAAYCKENDELLEIACGTGILTLQLAKIVKNVIAVDISEDMIAKLREKAGSEYENIRIIHGDVFSPDLDGRKFDLVAAYNLLLYIEDLDAMLARIHRLLKSGGFFVSATDCMGGIDSPEIEEKKRRVESGQLSYVGFFTEKELRESLERAGFEVLESENLHGPLPNQFIAAKRP